MPNKTAFVLSPDVAGADEGMTIPGVPGIWSHERAILPVALGYTLEEMRDAVDFLGLPLVEVTVPESKAYDTFPDSPNRLESARELPRGMGEADAPEVEMVTEPDPEVLDATYDRAVDAEEAEA